MMTIVAITIVAFVAMLFAAMAIAPAMIELSQPQAAPKPSLRLVEPSPEVDVAPQQPEAA